MARSKSVRRDQYRTLFEASPDAVLITSPAGDILFANGTACRMFGAEEAELAAGRLGRVFDAADPRYRAAAEKLERDGSFRGELNFLRGGLPQPCELSSYSFLDCDGLPAVHLSVRDIGERLRAEADFRAVNERMRNVIDGTRAGTWEWNVQTGETVFNEWWALMVGYTLEELEPVSIETWKRLSHPDDLERALESLKKHFSGETPLYDFESHMLHKDGRWVWVLDRGQVVSRTADGEPLMMFGTHIDITERKRAEEALLRSDRENRGLLEELQHRAKNSFNMICALIGLARDEASSRETAAALDDLDSRVHSIAELYGMIYSSGSVSEIRLDEYCARVAESVVGLGKDVRLETDLEPVAATPKRAAPIGLIVNELATNAMKHAFPGKRPGTIRLSMRGVGGGPRLSMRDSCRRIRLSVEDDGVGFSPGARGESSSGMGLTLARELADQIGGTFRLERAARGTRGVLEFDPS